jgi:hypothetical protein
LLALAPCGNDRASSARCNTEDQDGVSQEQGEVAENKQYEQQHRCRENAQTEVIIQYLAAVTVDERTPAPLEKPHA